MPKYFVPTCIGGQLQAFEMNTLVDLVGILVDAEEPRVVTSRGQSTKVCNATLIGPDKVGVTIGFWDEKADQVKDFVGQVVVAYACSVVKNGDEKQVNMRGKGSARLVKAKAGMGDECKGLTRESAVGMAIPEWQKSQKPIKADSPAFRTSASLLQVCSSKEKTRLERSDSKEDVTWEIQAVLVRFDNSRLLGQDGELWVRGRLMDHTSWEVEIQFRDEVVKEMSGASDLEEVKVRATQGKLVPRVCLTVVVLSNPSIGQRGLYKKH